MEFEQTKFYRIPVAHLARMILFVRLTPSTNKRAYFYDSTC